MPLAMLPLDKYGFVLGSAQILVTFADGRFSRSETLSGETFSINLLSAHFSHYNAKKGIGSVKPAEKERGEGLSC